MSRGAILEREQELEALAAAAEEARAEDGSVVLVVGEAGIGKSSLVDAVGSVLSPEIRLLVGHCDDLATPRVLGPLRDLTGSVGGALTHALESADEPGQRRPTGRAGSAGAADRTGRRGRSLG